MLGVPNGGTGDTTLTQYSVLLGNGTSPITSVGPGAISGQALISQGSSATRSSARSIWLDLDRDETLAVGNGGTGAVTLTGYVYGNGTGAMTASATIPYTALTALSANQILGALTATTPSGLNVPSCSTAASALMWTSGTGFSCNTAIAAPAGSLTGTVLAANVVSSSLTSVGTITTGVWNGTAIPVANGGTGQMTAPLARSSAGLNIDEMTTNGDSAYAILATDRTVATSAALSVPRTWTLPAASAVNAGQQLCVVDKAGGVTASNTLTVSSAGADTINGNASYLLNGAYQGVCLVSDGSSKWSAAVASGGSVTLPTLANGDIWVGNVSNVATAVALSQDVTITNAGVATVNKIQNVAVGAPTGTAGTGVVLAGTPTIASPNLTGTTTGVNLTLSGLDTNTFGADYTTSTATQSDVALGTSSSVRFNGINAVTFYGIAAGAGGQELRLHNASAYTLTLSNQSASDVTAASRIITGTNADLPIPTNTSVTLQYDLAAARWRVTGSSNAAKALAAGLDTQVQFNDAGSMAGEANFIWDYTNHRLGIGTSAAPLNKLDVYGGVAVGTSYAGVSTAPTNGLIVQGNVGIGTTNPAVALDVYTSAGIGAIDLGGVNGISYPSTDSTAGGSIAIGNGALVEEPSLASTAFYNTAIGYQAIGSTGLTAAAIQNTAIGYKALNANTSGHYNTAVGYNALFSNSSGLYNTAVGSNDNFSHYALGAETTGQTNIGIGNGAGGAITTSSSNVLIGYDAGVQITTNATGNNTMIGSQAGYQSGNIADSVIIGGGAEGGSFSTVVGATAATSGTAGDVVVGFGAKLGASSGDNVVVGYTAGSANITGGSNTILGYHVANSTLTSGASNILIGVGTAGVAGGADVPTAATSHYLNIGNTLEGSMANASAIGGETLYLNSVASSVNYVKLSGGATGTGPTIAAAGTDTNVNLTLSPQGTGNTLISSGSMAIGSTTVTAGAALDLSNNTTTANSSLILPVGTVSTRPTTGVVGMIRYNSSNPGVEAFVNGNWVSLLGGSNGALGVPNGGTGDTTLTQYSVLLGNGTSPITSVGPGATSGQALISQGSSANPVFGAINLGSTSIVTGTLAIGNGGTGQITAAGARSSVGLDIDEMTTNGDSAYTILATDRTVATSAALTLARTWTLPAANAVNAGQQLCVVDKAGGVTASNTLTVSSAGADTINGNASYLLNGAYQGVCLVSDGTSKWSAAVASGSGVTLPSLASGDIWVGNASNVATAVALSQDVTITNAGVATVGKIQNVAVGAPTGTAGTGVVLAGTPTIAAPNLTGTTTGVNLTLSGTLTDSFGASYSTTGAHVDVALNTASAFRYTGASAGTIQGIVAGASGQVLSLHNDLSLDPDFVEPERLGTHGGEPDYHGNG